MGEMTFKQMSLALTQLAIDQVQQAQSGHPGMPMGFADVATVLWAKFLRFDPRQPEWFNRDRFILSNGHGSALQYALHYLTGYPTGKEDLYSFRQLHSHTPGHPERDIARGIEVTTGPLGQGLANAVGIALAEKHLNARLSNALAFTTYVVVGDGCLMEGISHEAASMASAMGLGNLVVLWDDNQVTIDGPVSLTSKEDTCARFRSYGWHVIGPVDGHDFTAIEAALSEAQDIVDQPVFIDFQTVIGKGSCLEGTQAVHGAPLSQADYDTFLNDRKPFEVDQHALALWRACGIKAQDFDERDLDHTQKQLLEMCRTGQKPQGWFSAVAQWMDSEQACAPCATRVASRQILSLLAPHWGVLIGGSADLAGSVGSQWGSKEFSSDVPQGRHINFGVREFAMCAAASGMATVGLRPYVATFLTFSDYARNAIRMAALMQLPVIYIFTHDSVALGEDGPTHQPVEHLAALRAIPGLEVWRPANGLECAVSWQQAAERSGPTVIVLTRQVNKQIPRPKERDLAEGVAVIIAHESPVMTIIATGSEVSCAVQASQILAEKGIGVRVLSVPCLERLRKHQAASDILGQAPLLVVEAASGQSWGDIQPNAAYRITVDQFGLSAPGQECLTHFNITPKYVAKRVIQLTSGQ